MNTPLTDIGKKVQTFRPGETSTIYPCTLPTTNSLYVAGSVTDCDTAGVTPVGLVFPGDKGVPERADQHLLQRIRAAPRSQLESRLERWIPRQAHRRSEQDQHQHGLRNLLQPDRTTRARAIQRRASVWRQQLHFESVTTDSVRRSERRRLPESVQRHLESAARSTRRLVAIPPDDVLRRISGESADAIFGSVQPDRSNASFPAKFFSRSATSARKAIACSRAMKSTSAIPQRATS